RRGIHGSRRGVANDPGPGRPDQRGHGARKLRAARGRHHHYERDRGGLEPGRLAPAGELGPDAVPSGAVTPGGVLLEARHVTQRFRLPNGQVLEALRDVSLAVREHEVVALVGPSGCGKSTLLRLLAGLTRPADGQLLYRGQPLDGVLGAAAMVFQSFALLPWLTVAENVAMGLETRGVNGAARSQAVSLWRDPATGVNTMVIVTHSVEEAVFLAGRIVVFGSNPGHVREELINQLPYPRKERSPQFEEMVDRLHAILTATLLPEAEPAPAAAPQRLPPFARVHVAEVTGLLDHLLTRPDGKGPV